MKTSSVQQQALKKPNRLSIRPEHKRRALLFIVILFLLVPGMFVFFNAISSGLQSVSQVSALTERVDFEVTQPRLTAIPVRRMRIATDNPTLNGKCVDGIILPALKAHVMYGRVGYGALSIRIAPPEDDPQNTIAGEFDPASNGKALALKGSTYLEADTGCALNLTSKQHSANAQASIPLPLPIWGKANVGSEFKGRMSSDPDPILLLSGQLKVSARSVQCLIWPLDLRATLYPVATLDLPVGSRLESFEPALAAQLSKDDSRKSQAEFVPNWWGTAYVDSDKPAFVVELATDVPRLSLLRPNQHEPEVIEVSRLNQIFEDPNLVKVYKLIGGLLLAATMSGWLFNAFERKSDTPEKEIHSQ